jgi:hypothetical protein
MAKTDDDLRRVRERLADSAPMRVTRPPVADHEDDAPADAEDEG